MGNKTSLPTLYIPKAAEKLPPNAQWENRFEIHSETSNRVYIVAQNKQKRVKLRKRGTRAYWFLASGSGDTNRLRVHAVMFPDKLRAEAVVAEIVRENPGYEAKVTE